jgi:predicted nucleic acid-binding protein
MSGAKWLLDTNVVIGLLKGQSEVIELLEAQALDLGQIAVSQITRMELLSFPKLEQQEESTILEFLKNCQVILLDVPIEKQATQLRRAHSCKLPDAIVAATAKNRQLTLLTRDQRLANIFATYP